MEGDTTSGPQSCDYEGVTFANDGATSGPQAWHAKMTCQNCMKKGHIASFCENSKVTESKKVSDTNVQDGEIHEEAVQQLIDGDQDYDADLFLCEGLVHDEGQEHTSATLQMNDGINGGRIPRTWVLLDSQSTADAYSNPDLLTNIHEVKGSLTIHTQAGTAVTKL